MDASALFRFISIEGIWIISCNRSFVFRLAGHLPTAVVADTIKASYLRITSGAQSQQLQKWYPILMIEILKISTLSSGIYLYGPYMSTSPPPPTLRASNTVINVNSINKMTGKGKSQSQHMGSLTSNQEKHSCSLRLWKLRLHLKRRNYYYWNWSINVSLFVNRRNALATCFLTKKIWRLFVIYLDTELSDLFYVMLCHLPNNDVGNYALQCQKLISDWIYVRTI